MSRRLESVLALVLVGPASACASGGAVSEGSAEDSASSTADTGTGSETPGDTDTETSVSPEDCMMTLCDDDCVDLSDASAHCGECGFDCLGGECVNGKCQAVQLAAGKGRLFMVEVDDEHLYYGGDGVFIGRMNKDGTEDMVIETNSEVCLASAITSNAVLWGSGMPVGMRGCIKPDCLGGVVQFYDGVDVAAMHFNSLYARLFWSQGGDILQRDWPGGSLETAVSGQGQILEIESDSSHIYWLTEVGVGDRRIRRIDILGEQPVEQLVGPLEMSHFAVGPAQVYWSNAQFVYTAPLDGGEPPNGTFAQALAPIRDLEVNDGMLYWLAGEGDAEGYVERCSVEVCTVSSPLAMPSRPWGMAFDDEAVYWVTETGAVGKHRK